MHSTAEPSIGTDSEWCHQRSFAAERQSAGRARGFVSSHLIEHRLLRLVDPVRLVVDSLAVTAVVHSPDPFTVTMTSTGDRVTVGIKDGNGQAVARSVEALDAIRSRLAAFTRLNVACGVHVEPDGSKSAWTSFET
jgi:hypothetical protein